MKTKTKNGHLLTGRQNRFCEKYIELGFDAKAAHVAAGYKSDPDKHAWRNLQSPAIQDRIKELQEQHRENHQITADEVIARFDRIARNCEEEGNYKDALRANENLAKFFGLFIDKQHVTLDGRIERASEDELNSELRHYLNILKGGGSLKDMDTKGEA